MIVDFSSISSLLSAVEQITVRRRPLHQQQVRGHVSELLATQVASFTPKTRRRVRKMRPRIDRTTEKELTILVGFLQWRDSWSRPTQRRKASRKPLNISLFCNWRKSITPWLLLVCHLSWRRERILLKLRGYHVNVTSRAPWCRNCLIWYRLRVCYVTHSCDLEMYSDFYRAIEQTVYKENNIIVY